MDDKILFAVGGTAGHLFPAKALARDLKENSPHIEILFGGAKLGSNPFFSKFQFPFQEIAGQSPFQGNPLKASFHLFRGVMKSLKLIKEFCPTLVIGFGSFYSFPLLVAAKWKKIPYILIEPNAYPGRVNRLFSSKALFSAIQFDQVIPFLKGKTFPTKMPLWFQELDKIHMEPPQARKYYRLQPDVFTLLVFGGSQGAQPINEQVTELELDFPFQVIHFCGKDQNREFFVKKYKKRGIRACVKNFEERMQVAWWAADLAICRSGAGALTEMAVFGVPAILIPWPGSSEKHQWKNAKAMEAIGGGVVLNQQDIGNLSELIKKVKEDLPQMRKNLHLFFEKDMERLDQMILKHLEGQK